MSELLLEIFSEEIPALMQINAEISFRKIFEKFSIDKQILKENFDENIKIYSGPRRITIHLQNIVSKVELEAEEIKGPKTNAPIVAVEGFCKSNNIVKSDLSIISIKNQEYYVYIKPSRFVDTKHILIDNLTSCIKEHIWPKSMYWSDYKISWVRPIRNILCIFDEEILPIEYGHIKANNYTYGHRILRLEPIIVKNFIEYKELLKNTNVILDRNDRIEIIKNDVLTLSTKLNLVLRTDWLELVDEVAGLVEYPTILSGQIDEKFLNMPIEILSESMKIHQKYFCLMSNANRAANYFIFVSNMPYEESELDSVISGNEKVLSARLNDALYFYQNDLLFYKNDYPDFDNSLKKLELITFHAKLGSIKDQTDRLVKICKYLQPMNINLARAAQLCKIDLASSIISEFPELEGIMAYHYLIYLGEKPEIAEIILNHHFYKKHDNEIISNNSAILSIVNNIDSLVGLIIAGEKSTGSSDPFALRRKAICIIRCIIENKLTNLDLKDLIIFCLKLHNKELQQDFVKNILQFIEDRFKFYLKNNYEVEIIDAILNCNDDYNFNIILDKISYLKKFIDSSDSAKILISAYKRVANIDHPNKFEIKENLFTSEYEKILYISAQHISDSINLYIKNNEYNKALYELEKILQPLTNLFDNLMINDNNAEIAQNRLSLCQFVKSLFDKIANFNFL
jgi:glycyl-tRNA synthetase beta chain